MQNSKRQAKNYFKNRFGIKKDYWNEYNLYEKGDSIWLTRDTTKKYKRYKSIGIRALRNTNFGYKPTTYILQFLDKQIHKNVYSLDQKEFEEIILERKTKQKQEFGFGYIAFKYQNKIIGCGLQDRKGIKTQIPKGRTQILKNYLK